MRCLCQQILPTQTEQPPQLPPVEHLPPAMETQVGQELEEPVEIDDQKQEVQTPEQEAISEPTIEDTTESKEQKEINDDDESIN